MAACTMAVSTISYPKITPCRTQFLRSEVAVVKIEPRFARYALPGINISDYDGLRAGLLIMPTIVMPCTQTSVRPNSKGSIHINAAWTRRSKGEGPKTSRKSWKQRTEKYMKPFMLDIFISARYIHAKVVHRVTSKVISVATTNAKDLRFSLPSLIDVNACKVIGKLIAERSMDADVYAVTYELRKGEKLEGKLALVLESVRENGVAIV